MAPDIQFTFKEVHTWTRSVWLTTKIFEYMGRDVRDTFPVDEFLDYLLDHPEKIFEVNQRTRHLGEISDGHLLSAYCMVRANQEKKMKGSDIRRYDEYLDENQDIRHQNLDHLLDENEDD
jgi:hypothetical protein